MHEPGRSRITIGTMLQQVLDGKPPQQVGTEEDLGRAEDEEYEADNTGPVDRSALERKRTFRRVRRSVPVY